MAALSLAVCGGADSLIASSWYEQKGSAAVTDYKLSCSGTTCSFTNPTAGTLPPQRLGDNLHINLANPNATNKPLGTKHNITLIQSTWSSEDLVDSFPSEDLDFIMFGAWMEHSVFFITITRGQFSGNDYDSNFSMTGRELTGSPPLGSAIWRGLVVGSPVTGAGRGHRLQSDATLTY